MRRFQVRVGDLFYIEGARASDGRCVLFWFGEAESEQTFRAPDLMEQWLRERFSDACEVEWMDPEPEAPALLRLGVFAA